MKFSIITPSYNQANFLEQTIKSVVSQKVDLEYFIMDGGSSDGSIEIIKKYAKKYPFIKWQSKKDNGQVDAINQALKKCTGDIVAYINSDDYYLPNALKTVENYFKKHPENTWLVGNCKVSNPKLRWTFTIKHWMPIEKIPSLIYLFNWINQPSVFLKKELVNKVGLFNQKYHYAFDYDYWLRCLKYAKPFRLKKTLSVFRIQPNSKGNTSFNEQFEEDEKIVKKYSQNLITLYIHKLVKYTAKLNYSNSKRH